jgi:hypothetical protein
MVGHHKTIDSLRLRLSRLEIFGNLCRNPRPNPTKCREQIAQNCANDTRNDHIIERLMLDWSVDKSGVGVAMVRSGSTSI